MPINLSICAVVDLCCDWLWDVQLNYIGLCIRGRVLLPPLHASVRPPFLRRPPNKNEVPPVPIHPNKSTQHRLCTVYRPSQKILISPRLWNSILDRYAIVNLRVAFLASQKSTHISPIMEFYVRQVRHRKLPRCCLDKSNKVEFMLLQFFSSRH